MLRLAPELSEDGNMQKPQLVYVLRSVMLTMTVNSPVLHAARPRHAWLMSSMRIVKPERVHPDGSLTPQPNDCYSIRSCSIVNCLSN
jgi:hypothetical protein